MTVVSSYYHHQRAAQTLLFALCALTAGPAAAGTYAPSVGVDGTTAVSKNDAAFAGWADKVVDYQAGADCEEEWQDTSLCLGEPGNDVYDITCLGNGGTITLGFDKPVADGEGWDFAVFENGFGPGFLELAYVEVSSDGVNFVRFPNHSETPSRVGAYTTSMSATNIDGLAGKYQLGYGTPFDLSDLENVPGVETVDLDHITQVRLVDIVGDGASLDSDGNPIYDPYPTVGSGGFDLDAIGVRYLAGNDTPTPTNTVTSDPTIHIDEVTIVATASTIAIQWPGKLGKTYTVEESTDLRTWTPVKTDITGRNAAMILTLDSPEVATFYSVTEE